MGHLLITNNMKARKGIRRRMLTMPIHFGLVSLLFLVIGLFTAISMLYLAHFNSVATKGYELNRLQDERGNLITEHEIQNMRLSHAQALLTIQQSTKVSRMVKVREDVITYMQGDSAFASK